MQLCKPHRGDMQGAIPAGSTAPPQRPQGLGYNRVWGRAVPKPYLGAGYTHEHACMYCIVRTDMLTDNQCACTNLDCVLQRLVNLPKEAGT